MFDKKEETIIHLYKYRYGYKLLWVSMAIAYVWLLIESVKNVRYIFLPCTAEVCISPELRGLLAALWVICIIATIFVTYTGVWIILIEQIYQKNIGGKRK